MVNLHEQPFKIFLRGHVLVIGIHEDQISLGHSGEVGVQSSVNISAYQFNIFCRSKLKTDLCNVCNTIRPLEGEHT